MANVLSDVLKAVEGKSKNWKEIIKKVKRKYPEDVVEALKIIGTTDENSEDHQAAEKLIHAKISNLEKNEFVGIDIERTEDKSKALSYIGIEIGDALKYVSAPVQIVQEEPVATQVSETDLSEELHTKPTSELLQDVMADNIEENTFDETAAFFEETRFETRPSFWQRFKNSKFVRTLKYIMQIKVVLDYPALPEGRGE